MNERKEKCGYDEINYVDESSGNTCLTKFINLEIPTINLKNQEQLKGEKIRVQINT